MFFDSVYKHVMNGPPVYSVRASHKLFIGHSLKILTEIEFCWEKEFYLLF